MSVIGLHPEDLLDRDANGTLSLAEEERLERHLEQCGSCRLERQVRADFRNEAEPADVDFDVQRLLSEVLAPGAERVPPRVVARRRRRPLSRTGPLLLVAAALLVAGASAAAGWSTIRRFVVGDASSLRGVEVPQADVSTSSPSRGAGIRSQVAPPVVASPVVLPPSALASAVAPMSPPTVPVPDLPVAGLPSSTPRAAALPAPRVDFSTASASPVSPASAAVVPAPVSDATVLFGRANAARHQGDHDRAAELYRALMTQYPGSPEAHESQAALGRLLLGDGDVHAALHSFDDYLRTGGALEEDVMADRATALGKLGRTADEAAAWSSLLRAYPGSVHATRAASRLRELDGH